MAKLSSKGRKSRMNELQKLLRKKEPEIMDLKIELSKLHAQEQCDINKRLIGKCFKRLEKNGDKVTYAMVTNLNSHGDAEGIKVEHSEQLQSFKVETVTYFYPERATVWKEVRKAEYDRHCKLVLTKIASGTGNAVGETSSRRAAK